MSREAPPVLFVSHGAPTLAVQDSPAHRFLCELGSAFEPPKAILVASAHWESAEPRLGAVERPDTIHDFYGFPEALYALRYEPPGAPAVARQAVECLQEAGIAADSDHERGLDHGAWVPLSLIYPDARIPVCQISLQTALGPAHHLALGEALQPLRQDGVMILGSGSATHDLSSFRGQAADADPPDWVVGFQDWLADAVEGGSLQELLDYRERGPFAVRNHPSEEHILPLHVALGAAAGRPGRRLHRSHAYGVLAMDVYAFD